MTVSVVVAVRDGERYLGEALDSALAQTRPPDEIVVVEDGSSDGTWDVVLAYADRVRGFRLPPANVAVALNHAVARSTGTVLAFLDADDVWEPTKLEHQLDNLDVDPALDVVLGLVSQFVSPDADDATTSSVWAPPDPLPGFHKSALTVRRAALERVGPFDEERPAADFVDWWARALAAGLRYAVPDVVVAHRRIHGANLGIRDRDEQVARNLDILKASLDRRRAP